MKNKVGLLIFLLIVWMLLAWPPDWQNLVIGLVVAVLIVILTGDLFVNQPGRKNVKRYLWLFYYVPVFVWECIKANFDVAYRVIHPDLPIKPGIVKVKTKLKSDTGITLLANSITLATGTMTVDVERETGYLYIHWINVTEQDIDLTTKKIVSKFESILEKVFD